MTYRVISPCKYFLYHQKNPIQKNSDIWKTLLPMNRKKSQNSNDITLNHGDYFTAVCSFLTKNKFEMLRQAVSQNICQDMTAKEIENISIYLEKHGEFYHPARIEAGVHGEKFLFVVNVAISDIGKNCIRKEYNILEKLNNNFSHAFIPKVYGYGAGHTKEGTELPMFIGEWFEGYHEFHISHHVGGSDEKPIKIDNNIVVWDSGQGRFFLSPDQTREIYKQAAMIMTYYYNVESFEHIFPWHHAAGDFIVKIGNNKTELRLITVRDYIALTGNPNRGEGSEAEARNILAALLLFFLNLSVRMRLDRLDGVGDMVWADDMAVEGTIDGFFQGLAMDPSNDIFPVPLDLYFRKYILSYTESDLYDLLNEMLQTCYHPIIPEFSVIRKNIRQHSLCLYHVIRQLAAPIFDLSESE